MKILLIALDGLGDRPILEKKSILKNLKNKENKRKYEENFRNFELLTPLEAANKPNIDRLAEEGITGLSYPIQPGMVPGSDTGFLSLFGYDPFRFYVGRGILEALGAGIQIKPGELAFRANFCTIEKKNNEWIIKDRRAGRISNEEAKELAKQISNLEIEVSDEKKRRHKFECSFYHTKSHRGVLVIRKKDSKEKTFKKGMGEERLKEEIELNPLISDIDKHETGKFEFSKPLEESESAEITAKVVNECIRKINEILENHAINKERKKKGLLPANCILIRGGSMIEKTNKEGTVKEGADYRGLYGWGVSIKPFYEKYEMKAACVAGGALYKGVARYLGMDVVEVKGATAGYDTDLNAKVKAALNALNNYDFVFLHFKATDVAGHDGDAEKKKEFIEKVDKAIAPVLKLKDTIIILTADHSTPCIMKAHSADPVPILIWGPENIVRKDNINVFGERTVASGGLGQIRHTDVMSIVLGIIEKAKMFGT